MNMQLVEEKDLPHLLEAADEGQLLPALTPTDLEPALGLTPHQAATYMAAMAVGMSARSAATAAGLKGGLVAMIINRYRNGHYKPGSPAYRMGRYLSDAVEVASSELEQRCLRAIIEIGEGTRAGEWKALAWLLERIVPDRYVIRRATGDRPQGVVETGEVELADIVDETRRNLQSGRVRVAVEVT
jgi:hypothetical protein